MCLGGKFRFKASESGGNEIDDSYKLEIVVPDKFPQALPKVKETGGKIPRDGNFHVNPDGSLVPADAGKDSGRVRFTIN